MRAANASDYRYDGDRHGTVGAVVWDAANPPAATVSTGGMTAKLAGHAGDTPIFGAGTFEDDVIFAVICTGIGQIFISYTAATEISARMHY